MIVKLLVTFVFCLQIHLIDVWHSPVCPRVRLYEVDIIVLSFKLLCININHNETVCLAKDQYPLFSLDGVINSCPIRSYHGGLS